MSLTTYRYRVGDTVPFVYYIEEFNIDKQSLMPINLSDKDVYISVYDVETGDLLIDHGICDVTDASDGQVEYEFPTDVPLVEGMYNIKFTVINEEGKEATFPEWEPQYLHVF